jgi:ABC-type transport system substrate-binding protein
MRHFALRLIAIGSLLVSSALAASRPHYGGTIRVLMRTAPASLDSAELEKLGVAGCNLSRLLFDTLVNLDDRGIAQPGLATSWQSDASNQRWRFSLRANITFSDGTPLTAESAAAALRAANPGWRVSPDADAVVIQLEFSDPNLPAQLSLVHNSAVRRDGAKMNGTGPYTLTQWQPGKKLALTAREDYWNGRPFVGSLEIDLSNDRRPQTVDWARYQVAEVAPDQARRAVGSSHRAGASSPSDLLALVFTRPPTSAEEGRLRDALSSSIERKLLNDVVLQGGGEPARGLLPGWMTGYDFLFAGETNLPLARQITAEAGQKPSWTLGYDANDPAARLLAERIALNANDAGIKLAPTASNSSDIRPVRLTMASLDPQVALDSLAISTGMTPPKFGSSSSEELYGAERALLQNQRVIPLVHLKAAFALADSVNNWTVSRNGDWHIPDVWVEADKP